MRQAAWRVLLGITVLLASGAAMAETRVCTTTTLDEPFVMPGGTEHTPGKITLCHGLDYNPTLAMYVGYVDGEPIRMLFGYRGVSEAPTETEPYMTFARDQAGRLHLYGLAIPSRDGMQTFLFDEFPA